MSVSREKSALIAMSGGVDSSVAVWLMLQQGYRCEGTTMRLYRNAGIGLSQFHTCCSQKDIDDAGEVAFQLDIPYEVLAFTMDFKDQSYVLYMLPQDQLAHTQFPLGNISKAEARAIAEQLGLCNYTSGASESNNLAIKGTAQASRHIGRHIISTALEHASAGGALTALQQQGYEVDLVDIRQDGTIDLKQLRDLLWKDTILVSVCAVDSELGTVQPIRQIANILKDYPNCRLYVDATQAIGKTKLVTDGVDTMSIAPHKFCGLNGSGLLLKRKV